MPVWPVSFTKDLTSHLVANRNVELAASTELVKRATSSPAAIELTYGLVILVDFILTSIIIGFSIWSKMPGGMKPGRGLGSLKKFFNPKGTNGHAQVRQDSPAGKPAQPNQQGPTQMTPSRPVTTDEILRCASLLRQLYSLELRIFGVTGGNQQQQLELETRAQALLNEIKGIANGWVQFSGGQLSPADQLTMAEICDVIAKAER